MAAGENVEMQLYKSLSDICETLKKESAVGTAFVLSKTTGPIEEDVWLRLSTALAAQTRQGTKVITICGPRGEHAWEQNRL